jgi:imidazolonepropionase-like amidohydrolase
MTRILLSGARVFDSVGGSTASADVLVEDGRIVTVGLGLDGDEAVDLTGMTLLPGFFDCHVHVTVSHLDTLRLLQTPFSYRFFQAAANLRATLECGITSVRDAAGADRGIARAVADGLIAGPRMQVALNMISQTGGHGDDTMACGAVVPLFPSYPGVPDTIVDGVDEMRRCVRRLVRDGATVIKVATSGGVLSPQTNPQHAHLRDDELATLVTEATAAGLAVMAHAQATDGIKAAVRAGVRSIEHGVFLDDEGIEMMLERGTWLVPTLVAPRGVIDAAAAGAAMPASSLVKARAAIASHDESFRRAVEAGVKIAMGTDSGVTPHGQNLRELPLMAAGGMTAAEVLTATTLSAAQLLGVADELGSLEPGKRADLVAVSGDVLELDGLRERISGVWKDGLRVVTGRTGSTVEPASGRLATE